MKSFFIFVFVIFVSVLSAQKVRIVDAEGDMALPGAYVQIFALDSTVLWSGLSAPSGQIEIPAHILQQKSAHWVEFRSLGYQKQIFGKSKIPAIVRLTTATNLIEEVVVTGQYCPTSTDKSVHHIRIIDTAKMEQMAAVNLRDLLTNELNIRISQDNILGSSMSMQGIAGENVQIMIDGVPVIGRMNGSVDLTQLNLLDIERVEIIEGPMSVQFGSDALAGTINLITRKKSAKKVDLRFGNYTDNIGTFNLTGSAAFQLGKGNVRLSGGRNYFDGWRQDDSFFPDFMPARADSSRVKDWKPREQYFSRWQYNQDIGKLNFGYKGEYFHEEIINRGYPRGPYAEIAFDDYYRTYRQDHALTLNGKIGKNHYLNLVAAYNQFERQKNSLVRNLVSLEDVPGTREGDQDTTAFGLWMSRGSLASKKVSRWWNYEIGYDISHEYSRGQRLEDAPTMTDIAVFTSAEIQPIDKLTIKPALRYAYNSLYDAPLTPALHLRYATSPWIFRASYARGFRAPALKELFFLFVDINHNIRGNDELEAEHSHNLNSSVSWKKNTKKYLFETEIRAFYNQIENLITLAQVEGSLFSYINVGQFKSLGATYQQSVEHKKWKAAIGFSRIGRSQLYTDEMPFYSEVTASYAYSWSDNWTASFFYKYQGRLPGFAQGENDELINTFIDPYQLADLNIIRRFWNQRISMSMGLKNLFNVRNVNAMMAGGVHSGGGGAVPISTGRMLFIKMDLKL